MRLRSFALAQALVLALTSSLSAQLVMDANYTPSFLLGGIQDSQDLSLAQTFTITQSGFLSRVDLLIWRNSFGLPQTPLTLDIRTLTGTVPTEPDSGPNILASSAIPPTSLGTAPAWTTFTFAPVAVSAGQQLALALTSGAYGYDYYWDGDLNGMGWPTGTYGGGQAFDRGVAAARAPGDPTSRYQWGYMYFTDGSSSAGGALADLGFRTFLTPIPEPATATFLLLGGLASVAMHRCRRAR